MSSFGVQIREREDSSQDYKRPELLKKATEEIEAEVAALAQKGESSDDDDSSSYDSDEDEDDDANLLTPAVDSQIFRTIAAIQAKDPRVYKDDTKFFEESETTEKNNTTATTNTGKKEKEIKLKDYERQILLENGGFVDEYQEGATGKTHHQEQEELRNAFKKDGGESSEEEDEDFLVKKDKSTEEKEAEENDYKKFLLEHMKDDEPSQKAFEAWTNYKEDPNVNPEDAFLMDYVLNRGWVDKKSNKPTIIEDDVDKDEADLDDIDRFESKYNFRFEEEGASNIITYSRDIEGSVRRKQSKRAKKREREKLNKKAKKEAQMELLKQQKNQKMREIHEKLKEISSLTGVENIDLEGDYDPATYDAQMNDVFNNKYYEGLEGEENEKPVWDDDIETGLPDDEDIMDADYLPGGEKYQENIGSTSDVTPKAEPAAVKDKVKDLMEEYYALNYEDVIGGDLYTRFKYTKTEPADYGLTAEEILLADDAELNKYIGMKSLAPYRHHKKQAYEEKAFKKNQKAKKKALAAHVKKAAKALEKEQKRLAKEEAALNSKSKGKKEKKQKKEKKEKKEKKRVRFDVDVEEPSKKKQKVSSN